MNISSLENQYNTKMCKTVLLLEYFIQCVFIKINSNLFLYKRNAAIYDYWLQKLDKQTSKRLAHRYYFIFLKITALFHYTGM